MQPHTVIFDIGNVIIPWVPTRAFEQVLPAEEVPALMERIDFAAWNHANDARRSIVEAEEELVRRFPDDEVAIRAYRQNFLHTITTMVPGTAAVIAELGGSGTTIAALTNWSADMFTIARTRFGILERFRDIVVSGEEGIVKPDPEIYRIACERLGVDPGAAIFIDDSPANVAAANDFGLTGLHFTSAERLRQDLVSLGLLGSRLEPRGPIFHWALCSDWTAAQAAGEYPWSTRGVGYLRAGFVHCSFAEQVTEVRAELFADLPASELVLLRLDPAKDLPILVEDGYPHLFAPLPVDRVRVVDQEPAPV